MGPRVREDDSRVGRENARFRMATAEQLPANTADKQKARSQGRAFVFE
jgi:hypothetical protein